MSEGESVRTTAHTRSTTTHEENGQRNETNVEDVPGTPQHHPPPSSMPDESARLHNGPPSVELEGEWTRVSSGDVEDIRGEADASGASEGVEDDGERPTKLRNASERADEPLEHRSREDSPGTAPDEPDEPGGETAVPGDAHSTQEGPRCKANGGGGETSASDRDTWPGGCRGEQEESRGVEVSRDRQKDVDGAEYDGNRPRSEENERDVDTNALHRDRWPGGRLCERGGSGYVEGDLERRSDGDGDQRSERRGGKDGATSGARSDSIRVNTSLLADNETDQHGQRKRTKADVHRPSTPPTDNPRRPIEAVDPPRRRGRIKPRPRRVSTSRGTYQVMRTRRGRIGRIGPFGYVVYGPETVQEWYRGAIRRDEATGVDRGHPRARDH
jgi:hypothetical protein